MDSRYTYAQAPQFTNMSSVPPMLPGYTPVFMNVPQSYPPTLIPYYSPLMTHSSSADCLPQLPAIDTKTRNGMVSLSPAAPLITIPISENLPSLNDDDSSSDQHSVKSEPSLVCHSPYQTMYSQPMVSSSPQLMNSPPLMNGPTLYNAPFMPQYVNAPVSMPMGVTIHCPPSPPMSNSMPYHNQYNNGNNMGNQMNQYSNRNSGGQQRQQRHSRDMTYQNHADQYLTQPNPSRTRNSSVDSYTSIISDSGHSYTSVSCGESDSDPKQPISKRDLVFQTLVWLKEQFKENYDNEGERGQNVLRIKVKTRDALEHICAFIEKCMAEKLIESVSCPISTKKGRQHVRGYLLYAKAANEKNANRIAEIFDEHNAKNGRPFKQLHRNPVSTLNKQN